MTSSIVIKVYGVIINKRNKIMTLKLCQLIEHYIGNIFFEKIMQKVCTKTISKALFNFGQ